MTAALRSDSCKSIRQLLDSYVDGELDARSTLQVEEHVAQCVRCTEELALQHSIRDSLRDAAFEEAAVSPAFLSRLQGSLAAEKTREIETLGTAQQTASLERWRNRVLPMVAAAAGVFFWFQHSSAPANPPAVPALQTAQTTPALSVDQVLDRLVEYHSHPPKTQVEPELIPALEQEVGVRVQAPQLGQFGARLRGGSVVNFNQYHAAFLRYELPGYDAPVGRRITVYVYDPEHVPVHASLEPRVLHDQPIYVGQRRGYSIAARQGRGVGYAIATDLTDVESAEIIASLNTTH